jgi:hypothetical protein
MEALNSAGLGARRNEDIALDLLKFVAGTAGVGRPAVPATGFSGASAAKPEGAILPVSVLSRNRLHFRYTHNSLILR